MFIVSRCHFHSSYTQSDQNYNDTTMKMFAVILSVSLLLLTVSGAPSEVGRMVDNNEMAGAGVIELNHHDVK